MRVPNTQLRLIAMAPLVAIAILSIGNRIGAAGKQDDFGVPPGSAAPHSSPSPIFPIQKPDIPVARPDLASHLGTDLLWSGPTSHWPRMAAWPAPHPVFLARLPVVLLTSIEGD